MLWPTAPDCGATISTSLSWSQPCRQYVNHGLRDIGDAPPFGGVVPASWPVERAGKREGDHGDIAGCDRLVFNPCADEVAQRRVDLAFHLAQAFRARSEEHTSELQSLMRISYAVFCLQKKIQHV